MSQPLSQFVTRWFVNKNCGLNLKPDRRSKRGEAAGVISWSDNI